MTPSTLDLAETLAAHEFDIPCWAEDGPAACALYAKKSCGHESLTFQCAFHRDVEVQFFREQRPVLSMQCGHFCTLDEIRVEPIRGGA